jgi:hypothetical protein
VVCLAARAQALEQNQELNLAIVMLQALLISWNQ